MSNKHQVQIIASDAGGTMTDMMVVDREGNFTIGKAATTPRDQSLGFLESLGDGLEYWGIDFEKEAGEMLARLIREGTYALIVVSEALLPDPYGAVRREMRGRHLPVLLTAPSPASALAEEGEDAEGYMRRLIVETMGYEIKF